MDINEAISWLESLKRSIGQMRHQDLWHFEQPISEISQLLESLKDKENE